MTTAIEEARSILREMHRATDAGEHNMNCEALLKWSYKHLAKLIDIAESCVELCDDHYLVTGKGYPDLDEAHVELGLVTRAQLNSRAARRRKELEPKPQTAGNFGLRYGGTARSGGPRTK